MQLPYLGGRKGYEEAALLIRDFGANAGYEAAIRADRSRDLGNHVHFCRWREIERLIVQMSIEHTTGCIH